MEKHNEDFGQTFGRWGIGSGNYVMLPLFGPSDVRDAFGSGLDALLNPIRLLSPTRTRNVVAALYVVNNRAELLSLEKLVTGDRYMYIRDAYVQRREFLVNDGVSDEDSFDDGFDSDD